MARIACLLSCALWVSHLVIPANPTLGQELLQNQGYLPADQAVARIEAQIDLVKPGRQALVNRLVDDACRREFRSAFKQLGGVAEPAKEQFLGGFACGEIADSLLISLDRYTSHQRRLLSQVNGSSARESLLLKQSCIDVRISDFRKTEKAAHDLLTRYIDAWARVLRDVDASAGLSSRPACEECDRLVARADEFSKQTIPEDDAHCLTFKANSTPGSSPSSTPADGVLAAKPILEQFTVFNPDDNQSRSFVWTGQEDEVGLIASYEGDKPNVEVKQASVRIERGGKVMYRFPEQQTKLSYDPGALGGIVYHSTLQLNDATQPSPTGEPYAFMSGDVLVAELEGQTSRLHLTSPEPVPLEVEATIEEKVLQGSCPIFLYNAVVNDYRSGTREACPRLNLPKPLQTLPEEQLEAAMMQEPSLMRATSPDVSVATACPLLSDFSHTDNTWIRMQLTAEYYIARRRLSDGILASLESLASLDAMQNIDCTGGPDSPGKSYSPRFLPGINCRDFANEPACRDGCFKLKRDCGESFDFSSLVEQTTLAFEQIQAINDAIARLKEKWGSDLSPGFNAGRRRLWEWEQPRAQAEQLTTLRSLIQTNNPWLEGAAFKKRYNELYTHCKDASGDGAVSCATENRNFVCEGIRAQAAETSKAIQGHLAKFRQAISCLDGDGSNCGLTSVEFREVVARAPLFEGFNDDRSAPADITTTKIFINWLVGDLECRTEQEGAVADRERAYRDFAIGVGLTVASGGAGLASRFASNLAVRAATAGGAARAARLASLASKLERAAILIDLVDLARGLKESIQECGDPFSLTSAVEYDAAGEPQCPAADYAGARVVQGYRSCVLKATAWELATGLLPILPSAVSHALNLTPLKHEVLLDILRKDLPAEEAARKLREGGFNQEDIDRILNLTGSGASLTTAQRRALAAGERLGVPNRVDTFDYWKSTLNAETKELLGRNQDLERLFRGMDPNVRRMLTTCNSPCIPLTIKLHDLDRIRNIVSQWNIEGRDLALLKGYFFNFRNDVSGAIRVLEAIKSADSLRMFVARLNSVVLRLNVEDDDLTLLLNFFARRRNKLIQSLELVETRTTHEALRAFVTPVPGRILSWGTKLPDGTRIYTPVTLPDGKTVYVKYKVGDSDSIGRAGYERLLKSKGKEIHRGHFVPPGHGVEDYGGLAYNTKEVNLRLDQTVDNIIRRAYVRAKLDGNEIIVRAQMQRHPDGSIAAKYTDVRVVLPNKKEYVIFVQEYVVRADGEVLKQSFFQGQGWSQDYESPD